AAIHGLWTLHGLGLMNEAHPTALEAAVGALTHPSAAVRRNAVAVLPETSATLGTLVAAKSLTDADAHVRMAALLKIAELPPDSAAAQVLLSALTDSVNLGDRWLPDALTSAAARHATPVLLAVLAQS